MGQHGATKNLLIGQRWNYKGCMHVIYQCSLTQVINGSSLCHCWHLKSISHLTNGSEKHLSFHFSVSRWGCMKLNSYAIDGKLYVSFYFHISKGTTKGFHYPSLHRTFSLLSKSIRKCQYTCRKCRHCGKFVWYSSTQKCACISFQAVDD